MTRYVVAFARCNHRRSPFARLTGWHCYQCRDRFLGR